MLTPGSFHSPPPSVANLSSFLQLAEAGTVLVPTDASWFGSVMLDALRCQSKHTSQMRAKSKPSS